MKLLAGNLAEFGVEKNMAEALCARINKLPNGIFAPLLWKKISKEILHPGIPFALHRYLFEQVFASWAQSDGPPPAWLPDEKQIKQTNIFRLQKDLGLNDYRELFRWSVSHRSEFWKIIIEKTDIRLNKNYDKIVEFSGNIEEPQWLPGAKMNISESCFKTAPESVAIIYQTEGGGIQKMTCGELDALSNRVANGLVEKGYEKGDAFAIDMVMTAEAVAVYLGIVKAGCVVISIADSLAPAEVKKRLEIANAKAVFTQDFIIRGGKKIPMYEKVLEANPQKTIVIPYCTDEKIKLRDNDVLWSAFLSAEEKFTITECDPMDTMNILFSSGTTGDPKAIPWNHTTAIKCIADGYLHHDIQPGNIVAWPTNLGWMMGPWLIFASLVNKAAITLFYGAPTGREFGEFVQNAKVNMLGVVPSIVKKWIETGCMNGLDWSNIYAYSSTGECSNFYDMLWLMAQAGYKPVIEYCGGTEIGGGYITGTMVQPASPATFTTPSLGLDVIIFDEDGHPADNGELLLIPPSIGLSTKLVNQEHHRVYYSDVPECPENLTGVSGTNASEQIKEFRLKPVLRKHGDQIEKLPGGFFRAHGRVDDTMNLGGIKISSAEIERTLLSVNNVSETAAVAIDPPGGGPSELVIYAVLKESAGKDALISEMQNIIRKKLNPLFKIKEVIIADALPRTASNKVMRRMLRKQYMQS